MGPLFAARWPADCPVDLTLDSHRTKHDSLLSLRSSNPNTADFIHAGRFFLLVGRGLVAATMVIVAVGRWLGWGAARCWARLSFQFDILRLITRGLWRGRRVSRWRWISARARDRARASREGGKGRLGGDLAADQAQGAGERDAVGAGAGVQRCLVHEGADGVVDQQEPPDLLLHAAGGVGAQHHAGCSLVGLELIKRGLKLPPLGIQPGQAGGRARPPER